MDLITYFGLPCTTSGEPGKHFLRHNVKMPQQDNGRGVHRKREKKNIGAQIQRQRRKTSDRKKRLEGCVSLCL